MKKDDEIAELLGPITKQQMEAALTAINGYGFDISAPWEGDQDDREFEMFCGVLAAVRAASPAGALRSTLEDIVSVYEWCCVDPVDRGYSSLDSEISRAKHLLSKTSS